VDDLRDLQNVFIKNTDGVRVREHQTGGLRADGLAQRVQIHAPIRAGGDVDHPEVRHDRGGRIRSVRGVRHDDLTARRITAGNVVCLDEQQTGELAVRTGGGLERKAVHACDLAEQLPGAVHQLQCPLRRILRLERMQPRKARQRRQRLIDLRIILHGTRAERIEAVVHAVNAVRQRRIMPDQLVFAHMRQVQRLLARSAGHDLRHVALRKERQRMILFSKLKDRFHPQLTS